MGWPLREVNGRGKANYRMKNYESAGDKGGQGQVAHVTDSPIARQTVISTTPWHHGPGDLAMSADISLLVVGGGPAGVTAALQACELGAQVTVLEAGQVGGTSLNRGPAPVRTLARTARLARDWSSWPTFGLDGPPPVPNLPAVMANSERVARYAHDKRDM